MLTRTHEGGRRRRRRRRRGFSVGGAHVLNNL